MKLSELWVELSFLLMWASGDDDKGGEGEAPLSMSFTESTLGFKRRSMPNLISDGFGTFEARSDFNGDIGVGEGDLGSSRLIR